MSGDVFDDERAIQLAFTYAGDRFLQSGRKKYTLIFMDDLDKYANKNNLNDYRVRRKLSDLTKDCKDRGIIFVSTCEDRNKIEPEIINGWRTNYYSI